MEREEEQQEAVEIHEAVIEEGATPVNPVKKGRREPTIPTRTNPSRKAKESVTPAIPPSAKSDKTPPKAKRKVEFSPTVEESEDQEVRQAEELPNPTPTIDSESNATEPLEEDRDIQDGSSEAKPFKSEQPDEEIVIDESTGKTADGKPTGEATEEKKEEEMEKVSETPIEKQRAEMNKAKKGKAKAQPTQKAPRRRQLGRRTGGPVILEPEDVDHVLIESSDESEDEFDPGSSYEGFSDEIVERTMDTVRQYEIAQGWAA